MMEELPMRLRTVGKCDLCSKSGINIEFSVRLHKLCICRDCIGKAVVLFMEHKDEKTIPDEMSYL